MRRNRTLALALVGLFILCVFGAALAGGQGGIITGEPRLNVDAPDSTLTPGASQGLELQVSNDGNIGLGSPQDRSVVTAARNVRVEVEGEGPIEVETNRQSIGTVTENEFRPVQIEVRVPENAEPGEYELDVELQYRHNSRIERGAGVMNERRRTVTRSVDVEIEDGPRFAIEGLDTQAQIGDSGTATVELENIGNERAEELTVQLRSLSERSRLSFGGSPSDHASVPALDPGETTELAFDITASPDASARGYPIQAEIEFDDTDGVRSTDRPRRLTLTPRPEQRFSFADIESTPRVGEDGELRGTVRNEGPVDAQSVVIRFADESPNVVPIENTVAVGTIEAGGSATFELPIELTREAEAVPRNFDMAIDYRNAENERRVFEDVDATVDIAESRDEFLLDIEDRSVAAGSSTRIDVRVTNNLDEPVSDVEAKLFTDGPLDSDEDEGYVETLASGETVSITFEVGADAAATPRTYPLQMDFRYDDESGTSKVSNTYRTALVVSEGDDDGLPWGAIGAGVVLLIIVLGGALYWRRG